MSEVQTLARGLKIIQLLADNDGGLGVTEVANRLDVDKSSVSRMVQTLVSHGFAEQCLDTRRYKLGPAALNLSGGTGGRLVSIAQPLLERLSEQSSECSHIAVLQQRQIFILCDVESKKALRVVPDPSRPLPLHATALGKSLMAFVDIPLEEKLKSYTHRTIVDKDQLKLHLEQVRLQGYAVDDEEHEEGIRCLAIPVFDANQNVIATVGISGPAVRVTPKSIPKLAALVKEVAAEISVRLGGGSSPLNKFTKLTKSQYSQQKEVEKELIRI